MGGIKGSVQYQLLAQQLMARIEAGELAVGQYIPTEEVLCGQYAVSRTTVRAALHELQRRGMVSRRPRLGTRVESQTARVGFTMVGDSLDGVLRFTRDLAFRLVSQEETTLSAEQAAALELPAGQRFWVVTGVRQRARSLPAIFSEHLIPLLFTGSDLQFDGLRGSIPELLARRRGLFIQEIVQKVDVARLSQAAAVALRTANGEPALRTRRWYRASNGELVAMSTSFSPEGRYEINSTLRRDTSA
jgi:GntR family transcriptional regulator